MSSSKRTTHSDLADILRAHIAALKKVPAGYLVSDAATLHSLGSAADLLIVQDERSNKQTQALASARLPLRWLAGNAATEGMRGDARAAYELVTDCLRKPEPNPRKEAAD
jgi:hypothetical protein